MKDPSPSKFKNRGRLDKQNPLIALKVLKYLKANPDAFHIKWKDLNKSKFRGFVKFLAKDCGGLIYMKRAEGQSEKTKLKNLYGNMKRWYGLGCRNTSWL